MNVYTGASRLLRREVNLYCLENTQDRDCSWYIGVREVSLFDDYDLYVNRRTFLQEFYCHKLHNHAIDWTTFAHIEQE